MIHASLFSGIGGPEIAAEMMGWENAFHCEINPFCRAILEYWFPNSESYADITKTDFKQWRGKIDVLTGGFPCQPFSYAGRRKGKDDERYLWPEMCRVIEEIRPTWVVGENVAGIATMVENRNVVQVGGESNLFGENNHIYERREQFTIDRICCDLERTGYEIQPFVIPACAVGAPHRRDRLFIIAHANGGGCLPQEKNGGIEKHGREKFSFTDKWGEKAKRFDRLFGFCGTVANPDGTRFQAEGAKFQTTGHRRICAFQDMRPGKRWRTGKNGEYIPSVAAFYRGNDGFPFNVDDFTISFKEWHDESLKAYGNAIVPQVMYRIFEAIEFAEKEK